MRLLLAILVIPVIFLLPLFLVTQTNMLGFLWLYVLAAFVVTWYGVDTVRRRDK